MFDYIKNLLYGNEQSPTSQSQSQPKSQSNPNQYASYSNSIPNASKMNYLDYAKQTQSSPISVQTAQERGMNVNNLPYSLNNAPQTPAEANKMIQSLFPQTPAQNPAPAPASTQLPSWAMPDTSNAPLNNPQNRENIQAQVNSVLSKVNSYNTAPQANPNVSNVNFGINTSANPTTPASTINKGTGSIVNTQVNNPANTNLTASTSFVDKLKAELSKPAESEQDTWVNSQLNKLKTGGLVDETSIRKQFKEGIQNQIDSINQSYAQARANAQLKAQNELGVNRALNARSGLLGSTMDMSSSSDISSKAGNIDQALEAERLAKISSLINDTENQATDYITNQRQQAENDLNTVMGLYKTRETSQSSRASQLAKALYANGITDTKGLSDQDLLDIQKNYNVSPSEFANMLSGIQSEEQKTQMALNKDRYQNVAKEAMVYDTLTGKFVNNPNYRGTTTGTGTIGATGTGTGTTGISPKAEAYLDMINKGTLNFEDLKANSNINSALRDEVAMAISQQGGNTDFKVNKIKEAKDVVDLMLGSKDYKQFGYSSKLGGQFTTGYGDMIGRARQLADMVTADNLGLLKGPMSDRDIIFVRNLSGGNLEFEGVTISEAEAERRMKEIQTKLNKKLTDFGYYNNPNNQNKQQIQGNYQVMVNGILYNVDSNGDMTPAN
jgi:hypothetical protein